MPHIGESPHWDEQEVKIEDLDIPEKGVASLAYQLGEQLSTLRPDTRPVTLLFTLFLLLSLLLSSSALTHSEPQHAHAVTYPMYLPYTYGPCDGTLANSKACSGNSGHFIIINASPGPSNSTPQPWQVVPTR